MLDSLVLTGSLPRTHGRISTEGREFNFEGREFKFFQGTYSRDKKDFFRLKIEEPIVSDGSYLLRVSFEHLPMSSSKTNFGPLQDNYLFSHEKLLSSDFIPEQTSPVIKSNRNPLVNNPIVLDIFYKILERGLGRKYSGFYIPDHFAVEAIKGKNPLPFIP